MIAALPWLRIARVVAPVLIGLALVCALLWTRGTLERTRLERDATVADLLDIRRAVTDATVSPAKDGTRPVLSTADAKAALAAVVRERDEGRATLARVDRESRAARTRSAASDAALARTQAGMARTYAREVAPRVAKLEAAPPIEGAAAEAAAIERDSLEAWK